MKRTLKRLLSLFLAAVMLFGASPIGALSEIDFPSLRDLFTVEAEAATYSGTCGDNLTWTLDTSTGELVIGGTGNMTDWGYSISVPWHNYRSTIKGVIIGNGVTSISKDTFYNCPNLANVSIPDSVTVIDNYAFDSCINLTSIKIPGSVKSIGLSAFSHCLRLISVTISDGVESIGAYAFNECIALESITIPDSVIGIGNFAFADCKNLESVSLRNGVNSIGESAFAYCDKLTSITIPESVTSIGDFSFYDCQKLENLIVNENNVNYSSDENGVLFNKDKTVLIRYPNANTATSYKIPDTVKTIAGWAFSTSINLSDVTIGNNVTDIGELAFLRCENLKSVVIPDSVTALGRQVFDGCVALETVTVGNGLTNVGKYVFMQCNSITSVTVSEDNNYFSSDEYGVFFDKEKTVLINYPSGSEYKNYVVPDTVEVIDEWSFEECYNLESITLGNSVIEIGYAAIIDCENLKNVHISALVENIGEEVFGGCVSLESIAVDSNNNFYSNNDAGALLNKEKTSLLKYPAGNGRVHYDIPETVIDIEQGAFSDSKKLESLFISKNISAISETAFLHCSSIEEFIVSSDNKSFSVDNGVLFNHSKTELLCYPQALANETYIIPSSVKTVGSFAFSGSKNIKEIIIPNNVTTLGEYAFLASSIIKVSIPDSVTEIGDSLFSGCDNLRDVTIGKGLSSLGYNMFLGCEALGEIVIPDGVKGIGYMCFGGCDNLKSITIPKSLEWIAEYAIDEPKDIYYKGSVRDWEKIRIDPGNAGLFLADIHFNYGVEPVKPSGDPITVSYRSNVEFSVDKSMVPEGSAVEWSVSAEKARLNTNSDSTSCKVTFLKNGTYTVTATVDGEVVFISAPITVKYTWWQWIIVILLFGWIWY